MEFAEDQSRASLSNDFVDQPAIEKDKIIDKKNVSKLTRKNIEWDGKIGGKWQMLQTWRTDRHCFLKHDDIMGEHASP